MTLQWNYSHQLKEMTNLSLIEWQTIDMDIKRKYEQRHISSVPNSKEWNIIYFETFVLLSNSQIRWVLINEIIWFIIIIIYRIIKVINYVFCNISQHPCQIILHFQIKIWIPTDKDTHFKVREISDQSQSRKIEFKLHHEDSSLQSNSNNHWNPAHLCSSL